jgi:hypothetical protein
MSKERKDAWVAVAPEFATNNCGEAIVAPPVSAYQFFQREMTQVIKRELMQQNDGKVDVGCLTKTVAERWKQLPPSGKIKFENKAREDRTRYARESHARDVARLQRQEQLRKEREVGILADGERRKRRTILPEPSKNYNADHKRQSTTTAGNSRDRKKNMKKPDQPDDDDDDSFHVEESDDDSSSAESSDYGSEDDEEEDDGNEQKSESSEGDSSSSASSSSSSSSEEEVDRLKRKSPPKKQRNDTRQKRATSSTAKNRSGRSVSSEAARIKEDREQYVIDRQEKLRKERADQAKRRLEFLLQQSDIFSHFGGVQHEATKLKSRASAGNVKSAAVGDTTSTSTADPKDDTCVHRGSSSRKVSAAATEDDDEELDLINPETTLATYLTSQPSDLGYGTMRDYQLEGLNWMIRLQENGVNGILAGKVLTSLRCIFLYVFLC